jgi:hypothetical protein
MTQDAAEAPAADAPVGDGHDSVGTHPDAAPPLKSEIELREEAATQLREMVEADEAEQAEAQAAAEGEPQGAADGEGHPDDQPPAEGDGEPAEDGQAPLDTDEEAAAKAQREKPSNVREAMRRQRAARRDREAAEKAQAELKQQQQAFQQQLEEWNQFQQRFQTDPIGAMSHRLGVPPDQLVAQQADAQANQVPPAIQAQLDRQAQELADYKAAVEKQAQERAEAERQQNYTAAVNKDVAYISGVAEREGDAERFPYYSSLSKPTRERRALAILRYTVEEMDNPQQFGPNDLLEALDEQAKEDHSSLSTSKWLKQSEADQGQEPPAPAAKTPRRRRGGPSARGAAEPAPPRAPQTEAEAREAAAAEVRRLHKLDADERAKRG